jgi:hypothetical protein
MQKSKYLPIESTDRLDFGVIITKVKREIKKKYPNDTEDEFNQRMYASLKNFTVNNQTFEYQHQPNYLGGARWYILCPKCGRQCLKLYLPSKFPKKEQLYLCKVCHGLKNSSSLAGTSRRYKEVIKPLKELHKIRKKLLRKGMTPERAAPLLEEYKRIERELSNSPAYNLYKFQKEHGIIQ